MPDEHDRQHYRYRGTVGDSAPRGWPFRAFFPRSTNAAPERSANAAVHSLGRVPVNTTRPGQATTRVVTAYAAGCATVAMLLAIVLLRHSHATGQHARRKAQAWPTTQ